MGHALKREVVTPDTPRQRTPSSHYRQRTPSYRRQQLATQERDRRLFNTIAETYARKDLVASTSLPRRNRFLFALSPVIAEKPQIGTVVDVGCGIAASAQYITNHFSRYIGIDISEKMIDIAKSLHAHDDRFEFYVGDAKSPSIPKNCADLVLIVGSLHHMTDHAKVMKALKQLAKPNSRFVAIEPHKGNPVIGMARWIRSKVDRSYSDEQTFFSRSELRHLCTECGLVDIEFEHQGYVSTPLGQIVLPFESVAHFLSRMAVAVDRRLDRSMPNIFKFLSWDIIVRARFP